jgi:hypothetical protein
MSTHKEESTSFSDRRNLLILKLYEFSGITDGKVMAGGAQ